jgi:hypothetical protein
MDRSVATIFFRVSFFLVTKGAKAQLNITKQLGGGKLHPYNHQQDF